VVNSVNPGGGKDDEEATHERQNERDVDNEFRASEEQLNTEDFYYEGSYLVFTAAYHLKRGYCCNSGCRHCPYK
jgi:hypothetical protein